MNMTRRPPDIAARVLAAAAVGGLVFVVTTRFPKTLGGSMATAAISALVHEAVGAPLAQALADRGF